MVVPAEESHRPLSDRERQLFELASHGYTDAAIAHKLGISEATVATYWGRIRVKYGPLPRPELIAHILMEHYERELTELREQNESLLNELRRTSGQYEPNSDKDYYRDILNSTADAVLVVQRDSLLDWVNKTTCTLFGYEPDELIGHSLEKLLPAHQRKIHRFHVEEFFDEPSKRVMAPHATTIAVTKAGDEVVVAATLSYLEIPDRPLAVCIARPSQTPLLRLKTG